MWVKHFWRRVEGQTNEVMTDFSLGESTKVEIKCC
jgi:hypothetical protein